MSLSSGVGLITGLNVEDIISRITAVNQRPISNLQLRQSQMQSKISAFQALNTKLMSLNSALDDLKDLDAALELKPSTSDFTTVQVSGSGTSEGTYAVEVLQLATNERRAAQGVSSMNADIAPAGGSFSFQVGDGAARTIEVTAGMTLSQLRDAINALDGGVRASIVNDGTGANPYRLTLSVEDSGAANTLTITANDTILNFDTTTVGAAQAATGNTYAGTATSSGTYTGGGSRQYRIEITTAGDLGAAKFRVSTDGGATWSADDAYVTSDTPVDIGDGVQIAFSAGAFADGDSFTLDVTDPVLQQARNAIIKVDGITVQSATNEFEDAIEGLTLSARKVSGEPATVTVARNTSALATSINEFVTAYNDSVKAIRQLSSYNTETQTASILFGDSTVAAIQRQLTQIATDRVAGLSNSTYQALSHIGVTLQSSGELKVDSSKLGEALKDNAADVVALFAATGSTVNPNLRLLSASAEDMKAGSYQVYVTTAAAQARFTAANVIAPEGLSADETLSFTINGVSFSANLAAGDTLADIIETINGRMRERGVDVVAYDDGGKLGLRTEAYGAGAAFSVVSNNDGAGQTGVGTTQTTAAGVDVAGTINGQSATGLGRVLTAADTTDFAGLQIEVLADATGNAGSLTVRFGVAEQLSAALAGITGSDNGLIKAKTDGLTDSIESLNDRIERMRQRIDNEAARLRAQFNALEQQVASMQSQGSFLQQALARLI